MGSPAETALLNFGRYRITTNRNNFNRPRILIFRAKLHSSEFVSTPSRATMKSNRGRFREGNPKSLIIQRFQDMQLLLFQQKRPKKRSVFSGFQASEPAAPIGAGCNRMGGKLGSRQDEFRGARNCACRPRSAPVFKRRLSVRDRFRSPDQIRATMIVPGGNGSERPCVR